MVKSIGFKKIKVAVFISGKGSNLRNLIISFKKNSRFIISLVVSNKLNAKGLYYTKKYKINKKLISFRKKKFAEKNSTK